METMHLIGSEEVSRAGHNMQAAAESIRHSANQISDALERHAQRMQEALATLETILDNHANRMPR